MTNFKRRTLPAVVAGALGMGACAFAAEQSYNNVLSDAKTMAAAMPAMGRGYTIGQGDNQLTLMPGIQLRWVANYGDERKNGNSDFQDGFELTRVRLAAEGSVISKDVRFFVQWDAGDLTGGVSLLDAYGTYAISDQVKVKAGQFKDLVTHEGLVDWSDGIAAERSMVNEMLGTPTGAAGRVQGISLIWAQDQIRAEVAYHDGLGSANTTFQNTGPYFGVSGRVEFMAMGKDWGKYNTMSGIGTNDTILVIGGGFDYTQGELGAGAGGYNALKFAIDGQYEVNNLAIYAAFLGNWTDPRNQVNDSSTFDWGIVIQGAYAFTNQCEVFGRFGLVKLDNEVLGEDKFYEVTVGLNYYLTAQASNAAKVTVDLTWLPNGSPMGLAYQDILGGSTNDEIVLRAQLQVKP